MYYYLKEIFISFYHHMLQSVPIFFKSTKINLVINMLIKKLNFSLLITIFFKKEVLLLKFVNFNIMFFQDDPIKGRTEESKPSPKPEFNQTFRFPFKRSQRSFQRAVKSKSIKLSFMARGFVHNKFSSNVLVCTHKITVLAICNLCLIINK